MAWVVDTCLLIDVLEDDPAFGVSSADLLEERAEDGLLRCSPIGTARCTYDGRS